MSRNFAKIFAKSTQRRRYVRPSMLDQLVASAKLINGGSIVIPQHVCSSPRFVQVNLKTTMFSELLFGPQIKNLCAKVHYQLG